MAGWGIDTNSGANGEAIRYRECRRNHAASMGRYSFDGCGEFYKVSEDETPEALFCGACGCHRNFHRKETPTSSTTPPPPPPPPPPPMIIHNAEADKVEMTKKKKRLRTKLTEEQKNRMKAFAERSCWRPEMHDEEEICQICSELGINHQVFKAWVNNKRHYTSEYEPPQGGVKEERD